MTTFKQVEPLTFDDYGEITSGTYYERGSSGPCLRLYIKELRYKDARALRDWLNAALGEADYVRVPREPTGAMVQEGFEATSVEEVTSVTVERIYRAMLAAAPSTSAQEGT